VEDDDPLLDEIECPNNHVEEISSHTADSSAGYWANDVDEVPYTDVTENDTTVDDDVSVKSLSDAQ